MLIESTDQVLSTKFLVVLSNNLIYELRIVIYKYEHSSSDCLEYKRNTWPSCKEQG